MEKSGLEYEALYPQGWCVVPDKEEIHRDSWKKVAENISLDTIGRILVQLIVMFQVGFP